MVNVNEYDSYDHGGREKQKAFPLIVGTNG